MRGYKLKCEFTESRKSTNRLCRCAIARRHACRLCAANGTVAPPLLDGRKSVASITRVNLCASIGGSGIARSANRLRRCAIARRHARSLCAATGTVAPPLLDGRKSVSSSAHANMRATTDGAEIPRSGNSPPRRAIVLGYSPRPCARSRTHRRPRFIDGRKSVASSAHANMRATTDGAEIPRSGNSPPRRAIVLGYSPRPCARSRTHRRPVLSMVENRSRRAPTPTCTASIGVTGYPRSGNSLTATQILTATRTSSVTCGRSCVPLALEPVISPLDSECVPQAGPSRRPRCGHQAHGTPAVHCRRRFAHRSGHSRSTAPNVLLIVASELPLDSEHPRPAAGPSRRPRPTGRYQHRAHGTPAAHCRRRFAHRSGHSRSTAPAVLPVVVPAAAAPVMALYHCHSS